MATDEELRTQNARLARQATEALTKRLGNKSPKCPICQTEEWNAEVAGFLVTSLPSVGIRFPPPFYPSLVLTCNNCGFTSQHNLKTLNVEGPYSLHSAQGVGIGITAADVAPRK